MTSNTSGRIKVHPSVEIDDRVIIGDGTQIWHFSHILSDSRIGKNCKVGQNVVIGPQVQVGNNCKIQNNVSLYSGVTLEDDVFCGPSCVFTNVDRPRAEIDKRGAFSQTLVKAGATIGANATIRCGIVIGTYAFIGAGAVVTKDVPNHAMVIGNPAIHAGYVCVCAEKLDVGLDPIICVSCGRKYEQNNNSLIQVNAEIDR